MRGIQIVSVLMIISLACNRTPDANSIAGGTFVGYTFSEQAVVDTVIDVEAGYTLTFKAYDLGEDTRFIVYVQKKISGEYFAGIIRLGIEDPHGNVYTHYHSAEAEAIDRPIMWKRRTLGIHQVTVDFAVRGGSQKANATFEVPLIREPVPGSILVGITLGILIIVGLGIFLIRKRKKRS